MISLNTRTQHTTIQIYVNLFPDYCPHCHYSMSPYHINTISDETSAYLGFFCVRNQCSKYFVFEYFEQSDAFYLSRPINGLFDGVEYSETIRNISSSFVDIYHQAEAAEHHDLKDICGVGYRKALEFLIKDFIIHSDPNLRPIVENKLLAACIGDHIENKRIIDISKRAVWIGNDETHYVRKWEGMDITHLKQLIALTVHWIETEYLTQQMIADMPDPKKK